MFLMKKIKFQQVAFLRTSNFKFANENPFKDKELAAEKTYFSSEEGKILLKISKNFKETRGKIREKRRIIKLRERRPERKRRENAIIPCREA